MNSRPVLRWIPLDPVTNSAAAGRMMRMRELTDDPPLGQGVVWRSIDSTAVHRAAYRLVIAVQATAALLRRGAVLLARSGLTGYPSAGCAVRSG